MIFAALGLTMASQAPEFTQQYKQRLGGGIEELQTVINKFDKDAADSGLDRAGALEQMGQSEDELVVRRASSMQEAMIRYDRLVGQRQSMANSSVYIQPLQIMRSPDVPMLQNTLNDYQPAVPLTPAGALYGGIGAFLLGLLSRIPMLLFRRREQPQITQT